jgi:uncharacterized protein YjbI with pentapeptide repeats
MNATVVAAIVAGGLTLIGTIAAQILGRNTTNRALERQTAELHDQLQHQRSLLLNERFATAVGQLGSESSAVRLAGVYAMAGLADDWRDGRQNCIDALCAYLRTPYEPEAGPPPAEQLTFGGSHEVHHTIISIITAHLRDDARVSWQGHDFDFTGVRFDGGDFSDATFSGGTIGFAGAEFSGGTVHFVGAEFSGATIAFPGAEFSGATFHFTDAALSGGTVDFAGAEFSGGIVHFAGAQFSGTAFHFTGATFSGGTIDFTDATFSGNRAVLAADIAANPPAGLLLPPA